MAGFNKNGFTFKHFFIAHDNSPMKVTTDSCILGAWTPIDPTPKKVLDIGCGCGIIGLMLAQRLACQHSEIDAVDLDKNAVIQCQENIKQSPFNDIIAQCIDINLYRLNYPAYYDLIVTNPPYFQSAVACRDKPRQLARYTENLEHQQLINVVKRLIKPDGRFCLVLPYHLANDFIVLCRRHDLYLTQQLNVNYSENKPYSLTTLCFMLTSPDLVINQSLCMRDGDNRYTSDFRRLLNDFYLFNK